MSDVDNAAAWQSAINSVNQSATTIANANLNYKMRNWNEKMMDKQREWALADWQTQTQYNAPSAQMERLKAAGLNPNLVYGNGSGTMQAPVVKSSDSAQWNPKPYEQHDSNSLGNYFQVQAQSLQLDNLRAQNTVLMNDAALKDAQRVATLSNADSTKWDLGFRMENHDLTIQSMRSRLENMDVQMVATDLRNQYFARVADMGLKQAAQSILESEARTATSQAMRDEIRQRIVNLQSSNELMNFEKQLNDYGATKNDDIWWRVLSLLTGQAELPKMKK